MDTVYIETTVIGNIAGRLHPNPDISSRQRITREWWASANARYVIVISKITLDECSDGDPTAAAERLNLLHGIPLLSVSPTAEALASLLIQRFAVPATEPRDALHIATAAVNGIQYLLTLNFSHIANAESRELIENICRDSGYTPPLICSPDELLGV